MKGFSRVPLSFRLSYCGECVCMYTYVCVYVCVCTWMHMYRHTYMFIYVPPCVFMHRWVHTHLSIITDLKEHRLPWVSNVNLTCTSLSVLDLCLLLAPLHPFPGRERGGYRGLFAEGTTLGTLLCSQLLGPTLKTEEKSNSLSIGVSPGEKPSETWWNHGAQWGLWSVTCDSPRDKWWH